MYSAITPWNKWLDVMTEPFKHLAKQEETFILKLLNKDFKVLEIGSGSGKLLATIAPHVKEVVGIEYDYLQVKDCEALLANPKNVKIIFADAKHMPFGDGYFDLVIAAFNILGNQGYEKFRFLNEMKRVTKNGGMLIVSVYAENATEYQLEVYKKYQEMLKQHSYGTSIKTIGDTTLMLTDGYPLFISERFSKDKLARLFRDTGFIDFEIENLTDFSYIVNARK